MRLGPIARLDGVIRSLDGSNWITSQQRQELKEIYLELAKLRVMSDRLRIAITDLERTLKILPGGRVLTMHASEFYSAYAELMKCWDEVRPRGAHEKDN